MTTPKGFAVAIDGPVGVGKSTVARQVAEALNMTYIDTGAMYRAVALYNTKKAVDLHNQAAVTNSLASININLSGKNVFLNGENITQEIRTQAISEGASIVASYAPVREKLVAEQKKMAETGEVVMDGRDIGSQVLPWAQVKIYLDATVEERAARRAKDLKKKGQPVDINQLRQEVITRDKRDKTREHSPLIQTPDAIYIDTSNMTQNEVANCIATHINAARRKECSIDLQEGWQ